MSEALATKLRGVFSAELAELEAEAKALETKIGSSKANLREFEDLAAAAFKRVQEAEQDATAAEEEVKQARAEAKMIISRAENQGREIIMRADTYGAKLSSEAEAGVAELLARLRRHGFSRPA